MRSLNIRWKLALWHGLVLTLLLTAFSAAVYLTQRHQLLERVDEGLSEELADVRQEVERATDSPGLLVWLERRFARHEGFDFQVTRGDGTRFFASERMTDKSFPLPRPDATGTVFEFVQIGASRWRAVSLVVRGADGAVTIQVGRPLESFEHESGELLEAFLIAGPLTVFATLAGGWFLARRTLAPIQQITDTAREVTGERLDRRIPVTNPNDELGRLARTLNEMLDRLERSFVEMQRFTADAAHELRTPLAVIRSEAEVALRQQRTGDEYGRVLGNVLEETIGLSQMADELLFLCRQDAGLNPRVQLKVDLGPLLEEVIGNMRLVAQEKGVTLIQEAASGSVSGDARQLRRVFYNLIDNAVKYTPAGGEIRVGAHPDGDEVVAEVRDTGIGIPAVHLTQVFDRFFRVDASRTGENAGAGLGLAICMSVVKATGGTLTVESVAGKGSVFAVRLPAFG